MTAAANGPSGAASITGGPELVHLRSLFPGLTSGTVLLDNAGGSQVPGSVIESTARYMRERFVQLGADYDTSRRATDVVARAHDLARVLVGAGEEGAVVLGASSSSLCARLAGGYARAAATGPRGPERPGPGGRDVVVIQESGHEANLGPWARLSEVGYEVRLWRADPETGASDVEELRGLVDGRTALVALCHASNLLGAEEPAREAIEVAHGAGARAVVDGVAYAPHRAIDVHALDADWYVFSTYKVFGPHMAVLYGKHEAFEDLPAPNHGFLLGEDTTYRWELGGAVHETCAGLLGVAPYLRALAGEGAWDLAAGDALDGPPLTRAVVESAFARIAGLEAPLTARFLAWLAERDLRVVGPAATGPGRFPTISFTSPRRPSREIALAANGAGLGIRFGHFYAHRLAVRLGLDPDDGVVRSSLLHYNTEDELERLLETLGTCC